MVQQQGPKIDGDEPQSLLIDISSNTDRSISELEQSVKQMSIKESPSMKTCHDSVIQTGGAIDKNLLQPNIMTTSFDSSLMHSTSPAGMAQQPQYYQQQIQY
nr:uncharacterized protein LOC124492791 isoform X2 [Dermatophagoides farinae]